MSDKSWEPDHSLSLSHLITLKMLNNFCFHVYAQKSLSHSLTVTLSLCHSFYISHSFNLSFTHSRHAEQLLFSCLCSKVTVYSRKYFHTLSLSHSRTLTLSHSLIHSLSTCWTTFVFMSMLKSRCFLPKIAMLFWDINHPLLNFVQPCWPTIGGHPVMVFGQQHLVQLNWIRVQHI